MHSQNLREISGQTSWDMGSLPRSSRIAEEASHSSRKKPVCTFHVTHAIHDCKPSLSEAYMGGGATISHCPITSLGRPHASKSSTQLMPWSAHPIQKPARHYANDKANHETAKRRQACRGKAPKGGCTCKEQDSHNNAHILQRKKRTRCRHIGTRPPAGIGSLRDCGIVHRGNMEEQCTASRAAWCEKDLDKKMFWEKSYCSCTPKSKLRKRPRNNTNHWHPTTAWATFVQGVARLANFARIGIGEASNVALHVRAECILRNGCARNLHHPAWHQ
jgi:hypothetical protein